MKILFITHDNGVGGIWKVTENLAKGFMTRGVTIKILILSAKAAALNANVVQSGLPCELYHVNLKNPLKAIFFQAIPAIRKTYKDFAPDAVISSYHYVNFLTLLSLPPKNIIVCAHESIEFFARSRNIPFLKGWAVTAFNFFVVQFYRRAKKVVAVSDGTRAELISYFKLPPEKIIRIYNPVVTPELLQSFQLPVAHPWLQNKQSKVIVAAGRMLPHKDFATLIKAFAAVRPHLDCKLIILNDGPERTSLAKLITELHLQEHIDMPGFVENPYAYISKADLFVSSSLLEGFSLIIAEALASGCQVVATDCPSGPSEVLERGKYGTLVPMKDPAALAYAMMEVLNGHIIIPREQLIRRAGDFSADKAIAEYGRLAGI